MRWAIISSHSNIQLFGEEIPTHEWFMTKCLQEDFQSPGLTFGHLRKKKELARTFIRDPGTESSCINQADHVFEGGL